MMQGKKSHLTLINNEAPRCKQTGYLYWIFLFIASRGGVPACLRIAVAMAGRFTLAPASGGIACLPSREPGYGRQVRLENFISPPQLW